MFKHSGGEASHIQKLEQKARTDDSDLSCDGEEPEEDQDSSNANGDMDEMTEGYSAVQIDLNMKPLMSCDNR